MPSWGTLAPDTVLSTRRLQNLDLAASVRHFNDRSVPGIGGLWFPMPLLWSVLAVSIAEETRVNALALGNAIEALMMLPLLQRPADRRVRGARKLRGVRDQSFANLAKRGIYVVQPIRMAMVQPLVELGFVKGSRYGAFRLDVEGRRMLDYPEMTQHRNALLRWVQGASPRSLRDVQEKLSPLEPLPNAVRKQIQARVLDDDSEGANRRRNLTQLGTGPTSLDLDNPQPAKGITNAHWIDLRAGCALVDLRDAAIRVLATTELRLHALRDGNQPAQLLPTAAAECAADDLSVLIGLAKSLLPRIEAAADRDSIRFATECATLARPQLMQRLAERDASVVSFRNGSLSLGPAAIHDRPGHSQREEDDAHAVEADGAFAPQLFRLRNLHCLTQELAGRSNPGARTVDDGTPS